MSGEVAGTEQRRGAELHEVINKKVKIKTNQKKKKGVQIVEAQTPFSFPAH